MPLGSQCLILTFFLHTHKIKQQYGCSSRCLRAGLLFRPPACDDLSDSLNGPLKWQWRHTEECWDFCVPVCHQTRSCTAFHKASSSPWHCCCVTAVVLLWRDFGKVHHITYRCVSVTFDRSAASLFHRVLLPDVTLLVVLFCCSFTASGWRFEATFPLWSIGCCLCVLLQLKTYFVVLWLQKPGAALCREQKWKSPAMRTLLWLNTAVLIVVSSNYRDLCHSTTFVTCSACSSVHLRSSSWVIVVIMEVVVHLVWLTVSGERWC